MSPISRTAVVLGALAAKKGEGAAATGSEPPLRSLRPRSLIARQNVPIYLGNQNGIR
jgi:hypothetical protein